MGVEPYRGKADDREKRKRGFVEFAMDRWGDAVFRTALAQTRSKADAEDVFQDVFLTLFRKDTQFASQDHAKAWLLRVTLNRCRDLARSSWHRKRNAYSELEAVNLADNEPTPEEALTSGTFDLHNAVMSLPEPQRVAIHLFYVEECTTEEIAEITGCAPATVRTRLHRAREALKLKLRFPTSEPEPNHRKAPVNMTPQPRGGTL